MTTDEMSTKLEEVRLAAWDTTQKFPPHSNEHRKAMYLYISLTAQRDVDVSMFTEAVEYTFANPVRL